MKSENELRRERRLGSIVVTTLLALAGAFFVTVRFVVTNHVVPSASMIPTIHPRDRVVVNHLAYAFGGKPRTGDVVAYRHKVLSLYRLVAGPGDTIEMRKTSCS